MTRGAIVDRFMAFVRKDGATGCWNWSGYKDRQGYGRFRLDGEMRQAHRVAYEILVGGRAGDSCVCHRCDNPSCVNPEHLWLGSVSDNNWDASKKGRRRGSRLYGSRNGNAKISDLDVYLIREAELGGERGIGIETIAKAFGISVGYAQRIRRGLARAQHMEAERG